MPEIEKKKKIEKFHRGSTFPSFGREEANDPDPMELSWIEVVGSFDDDLPRFPIHTHPNHMASQGFQTGACMLTRVSLHGSKYNWIFVFLYHETTNNSTALLEIFCWAC